jgi:four helix bundle protein
VSTEKLEYAKNFTGLVVYQKAELIAQSIFEHSKRFPVEEKFSLTNQIRRYSRSIGAQIAEAWGKRRYQKHFVSKLTDADAEQLETQHWVSVATSCGYISEVTRADLLGGLSEVGRMLQSMIANAGSFCNASGPSVRERLNEYFEAT